MSFITEACTKIQQSLLPVAGLNGPISRSRTGFIDALISPVNRNGFQAVPLSTNGVYRTVRLQYLPQGGLSDILTSKPDVCVAGDVPEPLGQDVNVTLERYWKKTMNINDFREFCTWNMEQHRNWMFQSLINPLMQSIDRALMTQWLTKYGAYYNQGVPASKTFNLLTTATPVAADYYEWSKILDEYNKLRGIGSPIIVGDGLMNSFMRMIQIGCCNDNGIDLSRAAGDAFFFYDIDASTILGANKFAMWSPGALQYINYLEYVGDFAINKESTVKRVIEDPFTGIAMDFQIYEDDCAENVTFVVGTKFDLYALPLTMYKVGDPMEAVNGSVLGTAAQA